MFSTEAETLLSVMRAEIERYGQSIVRCDRLFALVSPADPIGVQYGHIFVAARRERWSVEFRNDGTVRFANLRDDSKPDLRWPGDADDSTAAAEAQ